MNKPFYLLAAAAWSGAILLGGAALADSHGEPGTGDPRTENAAGAPAQAAQAMGAHSMAGTVQDVDMETGVVDLRTAVGDLKLHFPPGALKQVSKGDKIEVHLSFTK